MYKPNEHINWVCYHEKYFFDKIFRTPRLGSLIWEHLHLTLTVLLRCLLARSAIILYTECSLNSVFFSILGDLSFAITKLPLVVQKMVSQYEWLYRYTQISCTDELLFYMQGIWVAVNWEKTQYLMNSLYVLYALILSLLPISKHEQLKRANY